MTFLNLEPSLEYILNNIAFVSLLIMTIWHWARLIYSLQFLPAVIGTVGIALANLSLSFLLAIRWVESRHFPLSNLYESLLFLAWGFTAFHFLVEQLTKVQFVGVVTAPVALLITGFASFSLPKEMQRATALIPALQSNWLMMHVTIMMISYVALLGGSLLAIAFLVVTQQKRVGEGHLLTFGERDAAHSYHSLPFLEPGGAGGAPEVAENDIPSLGTDIGETLDNLSYRTLGLGFPLLTIGILSGAVWANEAWGSYWSWDPKETWAFITWLVFAIYLHTRLTKGWKGTGPALIASGGFIIVWICYLGVNLLGTGLHSYGWFQRS